ncbi:MAG: LCP family protein [Chloroflexota bacterium]|nr:LCP family protein [Chloroflexota bacterium]
MNRYSRDGRPTGPNTQPGQSADARASMTSYRARPGSPPFRGKGTTPLLTERAQARGRTEARRRRTRMLLMALLGLVLVGGTGSYLVLSQTIGQVTRTIKGIFRTPVTVRPNAVTGPDGTPVSVVFPNWGAGDPVNILLIGLDLRTAEQDTRADTQIIIHIDPKNKSAAMLSIPRDLWVPIPGYGEGRVNSAYQHGDTDKVPGGGPELAMETVEKNFGIPIHYYAQVDFKGFERVIDTMGGVTIDVPKPLADNEYPFMDYGYTRIYVPAGLQHMDGHTALTYARSRHADSDIGRNSRQQQVLLALRQQGVSLNLITHLYDLLTQLQNAVQTDLSITQVGSLAQLSREISSSSIQTVLIDQNMVSERSIGGADVLVPDWSLIRPKIAAAFADPQLAREAARLSVQNGTNTNGIGRKVYDGLVAKGFNVPDLSAAPDQGKHPVTTITDFTGGQKPHTIEALTTALGVTPSAVIKGNASAAPVANSDKKPVDILVTAGDDNVQK